MLAAARNARATIRRRTREQRATARIARRGTGSLVTHAIAAGLSPSQARTVASSLRRGLAKLGLTGTEHRVRAGGRMRTTTRWTPAAVAAAAGLYKPRLAAYQAARARFILAA